MDSKTESISDSPWFWVYLFATCALIGLVIIQPKYKQRQAVLEQRGQARQQLVENEAGQYSPTTRNVDRQLKTVDLMPIILILGIAVCGGWTVFCLQRSKRRKGIRIADNPDA